MKTMAVRHCILLTRCLYRNVLCNTTYTKLYATFAFNAKQTPERCTINSQRDAKAFRIYHQLHTEILLHADLLKQNADKLGMLAMAAAAAAEADDLTDRPYAV